MHLDRFHALGTHCFVSYEGLLAGTSLRRSCPSCVEDTPCQSSARLVSSDNLRSVRGRASRDPRTLRYRGPWPECQSCCEFLVYVPYCSVSARPLLCILIRMGYLEKKPDLILGLSRIADHVPVRCRLFSRRCGGSSSKTESC